MRRQRLERGERSRRRGDASASVDSGGDAASGSGAKPGDEVEPVDLELMEAIGQGATGMVYKGK